MNAESSKKPKLMV